MYVTYSNYENYTNIKQRCIIDLTISFVGSGLIKSGTPYREENNKLLSDMQFIRTKQVQGNGCHPDLFYLPGSSLKGALRSQAERIVRTMDSPENRAHACNPLSRNADFLRDTNERPFKSCEEKITDRLKQQNKQTHGDDELKMHCPICLLFGSPYLMSALKISDAHIQAGHESAFAKRDSVAIDRFTGGAKKGAKFDLQTLTNVVFTAQLTLTNFATWQLGLLAFTLLDFNDGLARIGLGKTRGLGRVRFCIERLSVDLLGTNHPLASDGCFKTLFSGPANEDFHYKKRFIRGNVDLRKFRDDTWQSWLEHIEMDEEATKS